MNANDYILKTREDYENFKAAAGERLNAKLNGCYAWLSKIPKWCWFNPLRGMLDEDKAREIIQSICALAWGREIVIDINRNGLIRLQGTIEEWEKNL